LIVKLKKNGVDIEAMERKTKQFQAEIENVQMKLAPISDKKVVEVLSNEIKDLTEKQQFVFIEINEYLEPCIENELAEFGNLYMVYSLLEKEIDDKSIKVKEEDNYPKIWVKVFDSYDDFLKTDEDVLISQSAYYLSLLIFNKKVKKDE